MTILLKELGLNSLVIIHYSSAFEQSVGATKHLLSNFPLSYRDGLVGHRLRDSRLPLTAGLEFTQPRAQLCTVTILSVRITSTVRVVR